MKQSYTIPAGTRAGAIINSVILPRPPHFDQLLTLSRLGLIRLQQSGHIVLTQLGEHYFPTRSGTNVSRASA
jgi:hypothetical protein